MRWPGRKDCATGPGCWPWARLRPTRRASPRPRTVVAPQCRHHSPPTTSCALSSTTSAATRRVSRRWPRRRTRTRSPKSCGPPRQRRRRLSSPRRATISGYGDLVAAAAAGPLAVVLTGWWSSRCWPMCVPFPIAVVMVLCHRGSLLSAKLSLSGARSKSELTQLDKTTTQQSKADLVAPLTSFDWNEASPNLVVTSSIDTTCTVWDVNTAQAKTQLIAHDREVFDVGFASGTSDIFASVGADGSVRLFDLRYFIHFH
ncbi:hypothetical protein BC828DRAFT_394629 [Blastocladiella britannica]|nr:hypothetical protein BC828DRAFT_394629 [Blastocladiella britannica]